MTKTYLQAPDGGWGWLVVLGSVVMQVCIGGLDRSFGLFLSRLLDTFPSASVLSISAMLPVIISAKMLMAPLTTLLCEKTGLYRVFCTAGGLCFALGLISASRAPTFAGFYAAIVVSGLGLGFIYCPALCLVLKYFDRRRSVANGIGLSGPYFLIPILMEYLIEEFGFRGGLFIYGGLCLHVVLTGFVMKDIKVLGKENQAMMLDSAAQKNPSHQPPKNAKTTAAALTSALKLLTIPSLGIICLSMLLHFLGVWTIYFVFPQLVSSTLTPSSASSFSASSSSSSSSSLAAAWLLTSVSASEVVARPLVGALLDTSVVRPRLKWVLVVSLLLTGAASLAISGASSGYLHVPFAGWMVFAIVFGFFNSLLTTHGLVLIADSFRSKQAPIAASLFQFSKGIGGCIGPVVAGFVLQRTNSARDCFFFAAGSISAAGVVLSFYGVENWTRISSVDDQTKTGELANDRRMVR